MPVPTSQQNCVNCAVGFTDTSNLGAYTEAAEIAVKRANAAAEAASEATLQLQEHVVSGILLHTQYPQLLPC